VTSPVPPLKNGLDRVAWDPDGPDHISVIVTEEDGVFIMAADTGCKLVVEPRGVIHGRTVAVSVRAVRVEAAPTLKFAKEHP
jgi:hypothetical protein